ncbi:MAG: EpsG family protein [Firmicutes bacterium]|nr:EpsG family protein [Bacillota bacterium]
MLIYIFVAILTILLLHFSKRMNNLKTKKMLIIISFSILFIVSGFRYCVGTDFDNYASWFFQINTLKDIHISSFGFDVLILLIKLFTNNSQWLFIITSFIILLLIYKAILNEKDDYDLILYLFITLIFYCSSFNGIRQWIAIAILMNSLKFIREKNFYKYLICVLAASLFHITALNTIILYFLLNLKYKDTIKVILFVLAFLILKITNITEIFILIVKHILPSYYAKYTITGYDIYAIRGGILPILLCGGMFVFYLLFKKKLLSKQLIEEEKLEFKINFAFILSIMSVVNTVNELFCRIALFYIPFVIFLIPDVLKIFNDKWRKIFKVLIIILTLIFMIINISHNNPHDALPYTFYFFR